MSTRPFAGARAEEFVMRHINSHLVQRHGWRQDVIPYTGYGTRDHVRVLARVVLRPRHLAADPTSQAFDSQRGWRNFFSAPVPHAAVTVELNGASVEVATDRAGYVDVRLQVAGLTPGEQQATITTSDGFAVPAPVMVYDDSQGFGVVSDLDDTCISTSLPRLFIAAWNSFVVTEEGRRAVPGMARMYEKLLTDHPGAPFVYVSTGAWNTYSFLSRFLNRHGFPTGPMLLTDWGPTNTGWFRSGPDHKRTALRELARDFPGIRWVLVGDDGQHDPATYGEFAELQPDRVRAIAIRELSVTEQVLAHGSTTVLVDRDAVAWNPETAPVVKAPDGDSLWPLLQQALAEEPGRADRGEAPNPVDVRE